MAGLFDFILHLDRHLSGLVAHYGAMTYLLFFGFLFAETGFVITPFLPGDSLLFGAGALAGAQNSALNIWALAGVFLAGAILGDSANYEIGKRLGPRMKFLSANKIKRTEEFFKKHGSKAIVIARFVPIVRTFAPFVAGTGKMPYGTFLRYNVLGAFLWVALLLGGGYFFGNLALVRDHFGLVVIVIVVLSLIPAVWEWAAARREGGDKKARDSKPVAPNRAPKQEPL